MKAKGRYENLPTPPHLSFEYALKTKEGNLFYASVVIFFLGLEMKPVRIFRKLHKNWREKIKLVKIHIARNVNVVGTATVNNENFLIIRVLGSFT